MSQPNEPQFAGKVPVPSVGHIHVQRGEQPLDGSQQDRSVPALWRETLIEAEVELWMGAGDKRLPDELQQRITPYEIRRSRRQEDEDDKPPPPPPTGVVRVGSGGTLEVVKRKSIRREVLPDQSGWFAASLASATAPPALHTGATDYWRPPPTGRPGDVLANLSHPLPLRPEQAERHCHINRAAIKMCDLAA